MVDKIRELALKILYKIDKEQAYSNIALDEVIKLNRKNLTQKDIGLISEITYGVTTWRLTLDEIIKKYSKIRLKKISPWILNILRMGIYQIVFLNKIPKSAAVNESVNLAKKYGHTSSSNFVNAILRKVDKSDYEEFFEIEDDIEKISKTTSMPEWIIKELMKNRGIEEVAEICKNSNIKSKITIRVNNLKTDKNKLEEQFKEKGIEYKEAKLQDFLIVEKLKNIENLDLFKNGFFTIQDVSAGLTAIVLNPKSGENILDACSAPGGKTTYMAELMNNKGKIETWDIHEHRTKLVEQNAKRLGINIIKTNVSDATIFNENYKEKFDKILLDVPCLGIGVIKRKPDIKWQRKPEDIIEITKIQEKILENCSKYLKNNGEIVYSTCSILKEENEDIINKFLQKNKEFTIYKKYEKENKIINESIDKKGFINIGTNKDNDGFFICKLHKK